MRRGWPSMLLALAACVPAEPDAETSDDATVAGTSGPPVVPAPTSTGAATTGSTSTGPIVDTDSNGFIEESDPSGGGGGCPGYRASFSPCDLFTQNCPCDGTKCAPASESGTGPWDTTKCVPLAGETVPVGSPCVAPTGALSGIDDCEQGAWCGWVDEETNQGVCVALCTGTLEDAHCDDPAALCSITNEGVLPLCLPKCDPLAQDCAADDACVPRLPGARDFVCLVDGSGEGGEIFDDCAALNDCDPGSLCLGIEAASECAQNEDGCCLPFCDLSQPQCPGAGQQCLPWYPEGDAPAEYANVGACAIAPP